MFSRRNQFHRNRFILNECIICNDTRKKSNDKKEVLGIRTQSSPTRFHVLSNDLRIFYDADGQLSDNMPK